LQRKGKEKGLRGRKDKPRNKKEWNSKENKRG
jgi:hypothetical protein